MHWGNPRPHVGRSASNPLMVCFRMRRSASISPFQFLRQLCFSQMVALSYLVLGIRRCDPAAESYGAGAR